MFCDVALLKCFMLLGYVSGGEQCTVGNGVRLGNGDRGTVGSGGQGRVPFYSARGRAGLGRARRLDASRALGLSFQDNKPI